jgi:hypothetical protein
LFFDWPTAQTIWQRSMILTHQQTRQDIRKSPRTPNLPHSAWPPVLLTFLCKIWDARNALIFRDQVSPAHTIISNVIADLSLWLFPPRPRPQTGRPAITHVVHPRHRPPTTHPGLGHAIGHSESHTL